MTPKSQSAGPASPRPAGVFAYGRPYSSAEAETAIVEGIARTGRLVMSAALLLGLAFVAFGLRPGTEAKIFALALGGGIRIDATIIRRDLAAADALFGRWNSEVGMLQESFRFGTALRDAQLPLHFQ